VRPRRGRGRTPVAPGWGGLRSGRELLANSTRTRKRGRRSASALHDHLGLGEPGRRLDGADLERVLTARLEQVDGVFGVARPDDRAHADAHVERTQHLVWRDVAGLLDAVE